MEWKLFEGNRSTRSKIVQVFPSKILVRVVLYKTINFEVEILCALWRYCVFSKELIGSFFYSYSLLVNSTKEKKNEEFDKEFSRI